MRKIFVAIAAILLLGLAGWAANSRLGERAQAAQAPATSTVAHVTAVTAASTDVANTVSGIGSVQAFNTVAIKPRVDGQIVKVDFTEGKEVKQGDPLFEIDPRPFQALLAQAQANRQKDVAMLTSAQADLARDANLAGRGFQTQQAYDQQKAPVGQLQASIAADDAAIQTAQLNLDYATIRSPIDGRTGARQVDIGNVVHASDTTSLVTITQLRPIFVSFTLPQLDLDPVRAAQASGPVAVTAVSQATGRQLAQGTLSLLDNQVDQASGTIHLKAQFVNDDAALWPGEFVSLKLVTGVERGAVTVPSRVIQQGPNGPYLYVIRPDNTVELRSVTLGQADDSSIVVATGLKGGERVVLDGQYGISPDGKVAVEAAAPATPPG